MERYTKVKPIGSGTFGQAWLVESVVSHRKYALKELGVVSMSEQDRHLALNEAKILSKLKHKNIVRYKEAFVAQGKLCIAMEFAEKGDLYTRIRERNERYFTEVQILEWFTQLCLALKYIHGQNILHRDLKTQNIFLSKDDVIKLGDFGIARMLNSTLDHAQTTVGTPYYLSPEICQRKPYNHKSDMWSLGCVLYEMTTLKHAFNANNFSALVVKILQGQYPPIPRFYGPLLEDLVAVLLQKNPDDRPSAKQLLYVPAMEPYVKRFILSERERTDSVASDISISTRPSPECSQISMPGRQGKANDVDTLAHVCHNSTSLVQADRVKVNPSIPTGGSRVDSYGERKLSSNNTSTENSQERDNMAVFVDTEKDVNAIKPRKRVPACDDVEKSRQNIPVSENLIKLREKLRSRCSVSTRRNSVVALAHAQHRRYSEQNLAPWKPGTRIQKERILSQGALSEDISEADDVFAKNQATVIPVRSSNTTNVRKGREINDHDVNANYSSSSKCAFVAEQRRQKPALSVCQPQCSEDMRTRKRHQSAVTVLDRNCWPIERKHRRLSSRTGSNNKENGRFVTARAQVPAKRRASSGALKTIQASDVEKQQTVEAGSGRTGSKCEGRKRTYTVSHERKSSKFEIPEVEEKELSYDDSQRCKDGNGSCKNAKESSISTNEREAERLSRNEKRVLDCESEDDRRFFNLESEKQIHSSVRGNISHLTTKPSDLAAVDHNTSKPSCKFTLCGKTLYLDDVSSHDSVYTHMEALRMHLEKKLGTRLLTAVYRYVTNVSLQEDERVRHTVKCMIGEQNMVYFPVLLQLVACEAIYFH